MTVTANPGYNFRVEVPFARSRGIPANDSKTVSADPDLGRGGSSLVRLDVAAAEATLGPPPLADEVQTIVVPSRRTNSNALALAPGFKLGHFEILEAIGSGGMATVLKARDLELGRIVALKILPPDSARDPDSVTRFKQEARAAAKLDHENVARVFFCGEDQGLQFIAFEFVEGDTLRGLIDRHTVLAPGDCIRYLLQLAAGLQHASDRGVIHRDVKPGNIVITPDGRAKLIDMGLARQQGGHSVNGGVTQSGMTLGTFDYISPEQALDPRSVDVRSDIYSLGCAFYHALTGRPPVPEGTAAKKLHAHQHEPPVDPRQLNPKVPDALAIVLSGMMVKDRNKRYSNPDALIRDLLRVAEELGLNLDPNTIGISQARSGSSISPALARRERKPISKSVYAWALIVGVCAVVLGFALRGNKSIALNWDEDVKPERPVPLWINGPTPTAPPSLAKQTVRPTDAGQLLTALALPNVVIQLEAGKIYDISTTAGAVFAGRELVIESPSSASPGTIRLAGSPLDTETPNAIRAGGLTITGAESVKFQGVKLVLTQNPGGANDSPPVGLALDGVGRFELHQSQIELDPAATSAEGIAIHSRRGKRAEPTSFVARNTVFASRRWIGWECGGGTKAVFTECGFVTSRIALATSGSGSTSFLEMQCCSFLLENRGVGVEIGEGANATVRPGFCVFGSTNIEPPGMMMPEPGERRAAAIRAATGATLTITATSSEPSVCYRADIPPGWDGVAEIPNSPWASASPLVKLDAAEPWKAFELNPRWKSLRVPGRADVQILGVKQLPNDSSKIYGTWPPGGAAENLPAGVKVWYPNPPAADVDSLPANVFDNLALALAALKPGDKLLIRGRGVIEVPALPAITKADFRATIRPEDEKASLILTPIDPTRRDSAMFRIEDGDIRFERIEFRLKPSLAKAGDIRSQSIVALAGGRRCEFSRCILTLNQQKDERLAAVALVDQSEQMRPSETPRRPLIRMEDCMVRGRGRVVWATAAAPFDFAASNTLLALNSPVVEVDPPTAAFPAGSAIGLQFSQVTGWLGAGLLDVRCGKPLDDKPGLFLPVDIRTDGCLFAPVGGATVPLAAVLGADVNQWERYVTWSAGVASAYANYAESGLFLEVAGDDPDGKSKRLDFAEGLLHIKEKASALGKALFFKEPDAEKFAGLQPDDAAVKDSPFGAGVGCKVKDLPKPGR